MANTYKYKLERFGESDFAYYLSLVSDIKVMATITGKALNAAEARDSFDRILNNNSIHPLFGYFKILDAGTGTFTGLARLSIDSAESREAELGYMILPEYQGQGIAGKIARVLTEIARTQTTLENIIAVIDPQNVPSRKILINNGFVSKELKDFDGLVGEILELRFK